MSLFEQSFERELGKNTGKWVSNVIFGDKHSTPYRRVGSNRVHSEVIYREPKASKTELRHQELISQISRENYLKEKMYNDQQESMKKNSQIEYLNLMRSNIKQALLLTANDFDTFEDYVYEIISFLDVREWVRPDKTFWKESFEQKKQTIENKLNDIYLEKLKKSLKNRPVEFSKEKEKELRNYIYKFDKQRLSSFAGAYGVAWVNIKTVFSWFFRIILIKRTISVENVSETPKIGNATSEKEDLEKQSIFIDLNENFRIENRLTKIWEKYSNLVNSEIITRKPIFSADGVTDSILFIGINPSFNSSDDTTFLKSNDEKSLMYGSFYQIPDAPEYFKVLENFSNQVNKGYTHINLLYARENNRDLLLNSDHNFIREQLELTYETILKIKPIAIVFFSDYCKNLIFGHDRWVNPNNELNDHYILNGTSFPVFFTNDITSMTETERRDLLNKIQKNISTK